MKSGPGQVSGGEKSLCEGPRGREEGSSELQTGRVRAAGGRRAGWPTGQSLATSGAGAAPHRRAPPTDRPGLASAPSWQAGLYSRSAGERRAEWVRTLCPGVRGEVDGGREWAVGVSGGGLGEGLGRVPRLCGSGFHPETDPFTALLAFSASGWRGPGCTGGFKGSRLLPPQHRDSPRTLSSALEKTAPCLFSATHWYMPASDRFAAVRFSVPCSMWIPACGRKEAHETGTFCN